MIQIRKNCFETNSSSTHCLSIIGKPVYDNWRNHKIVLNINYIFNSTDNLKNDSINVISDIPSNFINCEKSKELSMKQYGNEFHEYEFGNLSYGDNGFMRSWGNFDTNSSIVKFIQFENQINENTNILYEYLNNDSWYIDYLKESSKYENFIKLIEEYKNSGKFIIDMYKMFPNHILYYTPEEYVEMLKYDDCYSPFIHVYNDIVAFGYYFHS